MYSFLNKRINLAHVPTPIQYYPRLSEILGIQLFIKRDDLSESIASGNKIRKLEYCLFDAINNNADTLVTVGGIQSNHCRATAWAAARTGLACHLLVRGSFNPPAQGNLLLDYLLGASISFYTPEEFNTINTIASNVCSELASEGKRPYYIPLGASNAVGSLGYIRMMKEISESGEQFDHLYCAVGSGGTFAGIRLGAHLFEIPIRVTGIAVCNDTNYFVQEVQRINHEFQDIIEQSIDDTSVCDSIDDTYIGLGYGHNSEVELKQLMKISQHEGLILDPVYTLKAFMGMVGHIRKNIIKPGERVLFLHSGGHFGLFSKYAEFENILNYQ